MFRTGPAVRLRVSPITEIWRPDRIDSRPRARTFRSHAAAEQRTGGDGRRWGHRPLEVLGRLTGGTGAAGDPSASAAPAGRAGRIEEPIWIWQRQRSLRCTILDSPMETPLLGRA